MPRKTWEGSQLLPLVDFDIIEKQEVKAKAELSNAWLRIASVSQHIQRDPCGISLVVQGLRLCLLTQGVWDQFLLGNYDPTCHVVWPKIKK